MTHRLDTIGIGIVPNEKCSDCISISDRGRQRRLFGSVSMETASLDSPWNGLAVGKMAI